MLSKSKLPFPGLAIKGILTLFLWHWVLGTPDWPIIGVLLTLPYYVYLRKCHQKQSLSHSWPWTNEPHAAQKYTCLRPSWGTFTPAMEHSTSWVKVSSISNERALAVLGDVMVRVLVPVPSSNSDLTRLDKALGSSLKGCCDRPGSGWIATLKLIIFTDLSYFLVDEFWLDFALYDKEGYQLAPNSIVLLCFKSLAAMVGFFYLLCDPVWFSLILMAKNFLSDWLVLFPSERKWLNLVKFVTEKI